MSPTIPNRTDLLTSVVDQATRLSELIAEKPAALPAASAQTGAATDQLVAASPPALGEVVRSEAAKLDKLLERLRNVSIGAAFEQVLRGLPPSAIAAVDALHENLPIRPGQSVQEAYRGAYRALLATDHDVRAQAIELAKTAYAMIQKVDLEALEPMHRAFSIDRYVHQQQASADEAAHQAASQANRGKRFWERHVQPELKPVDRAAIDATIAAAQEQVRAINRDFTAAGVPPPFHLRVPFTTEGSHTAASLASLAKDPARHECLVEATAILLRRSAAVVDVNKQMLALRDFAQRGRPDVVTLQAVRDALLATTPQEIMLEVHQILSDLSRVAAEETVAKGVVRTEGVERSVSASRSQLRLGDGWKTNTRGDTVRRNPLFTNDSESVSQRTFSMTSEYLLPEARDYVVDIYRYTPNGRVPPATPQGERFLFVGEQGFLLDTLVRLDRLYETLSFIAPGSHEEEQLRSFMEDSTLSLRDSDRRSVVQLKFSRLREQIAHNTETLGAGEGYGATCKVLEAELASPLRRV